MDLGLLVYGTDGQGGIVDRFHYEWEDEECGTHLRYQGKPNRDHSLDFRSRYHARSLQRMMDEHDAPFLLEWWLRPTPGQLQPTSTTAHYRREDAFLGGMMAYDKAETDEALGRSPDRIQLTPDLPTVGPRNAVVVETRIPRLPQRMDFDGPSISEREKPWRDSWWDLTGLARGLNAPGIADAIHAFQAET